MYMCTWSVTCYGPQVGNRATISHGNRKVAGALLYNSDPKNNLVISFVRTITTLWETSATYTITCTSSGYAATATFGTASTYTGAKKTAASKFANMITAMGSFNISATAGASDSITTTVLTWTKSAQTGAFTPSPTYPSLTMSCTAGSTTVNSVRAVEPGATTAVTPFVISGLPNPNEYNLKAAVAARRPRSRSLASFVVELGPAARLPSHHLDLERVRAGAAPARPRSRSALPGLRALNLRRPSLSVSEPQLRVDLDGDEGPSPSLSTHARTDWKSPTPRTEPPTPSPRPPAPLPRTPAPAAAEGGAGAPAATLSAVPAALRNASRIKSRSLKNFLVEVERGARLPSRPRLQAIKFRRPSLSVSEPQLRVDLNGDADEASPAPTPSAPLPPPAAGRPRSRSALPAPRALNLRRPSLSASEPQLRVDLEGSRGKPAVPASPSPAPAARPPPPPSPSQRTRAGRPRSRSALPWIFRGAQGAAGPTGAAGPRLRVDLEERVSEYVLEPAAARGRRPSSSSHLPPALHAPQRRPTRSTAWAAAELLLTQ
eukprot:tig00000789_g4100.t1